MVTFVVKVSEQVYPDVEFRSVNRLHMNLRRRLAKPIKNCIFLFHNSVSASSMLYACVEHVVCAHASSMLCDTMTVLCM